jgi:RES domain-containing protein
MPASLVLVEIALDDLPKDWRDRPYPSAIQALGDKWLAASPVVSVPSAVIKQERNYLINPLHSGYPADRWQQVSGFDFDPRLPWTK